MIGLSSLGVICIQTSLKVGLRGAAGRTGASAAADDNRRSSCSWSSSPEVRGKALLRKAHGLDALRSVVEAAASAIEMACSDRVMR